MFGVDISKTDSVTDISPSDICIYSVYNIPFLRTPSVPVEKVNVQKMQYNSTRKVHNKSTYLEVLE